MPVNQDAANDWSQNTSSNKWTSGINERTNDPSEGLERAGVDMAGRGGEFDSKWERNSDTQAARSKYDDNTGSEQASKWLNAMQSASDWNI